MFLCLQNEKLKRADTDETQLSLNIEIQFEYFNPMAVRDHLATTVNHIPKEQFLQIQQ